MQDVKGSPSSGAAAQQGAGAGGTLRSLLQNNLFVMIFLIVVLFVAGFLINPRLLDVGNLQIMTRDIAILAIGSIGVGFTILVAGIDLSVGSIVGFAGVMVAWFMMDPVTGPVWYRGLPVWLSILLTMGLGVAIGAFNGFYVTRLHMHGFLITLVTMGLARGFILVLTNAFPIPGLPRSFTVIGQGYLFGVIPIPVVIMVIVAGLTYYLLRYTYIGRQIYATGGNPDAARFSGVNIDARIMLCYIISTVCASIVGIIQAARLSLGHPQAGEGFELLAITSCILGGISFMGGQGGIPGILVGATLIGLLQNFLVMVNVNPYWHKIVISLVLLAAITVDYLRRQRR